MALAVALAPSQAAAAPLYSNGGLNPRATSKSGVAAPSGSFWSEVQNDAGNTTEANNIIGSAVTSGAQHLADDFTVPAGATWTINSIDVYGYQISAAASPSPFTACNIQIWNGRPGDPGAAVIAGDLTTNRLAASIDTNIFRISNSTVPAPGTAPVTTRRIWRNHAVFSTPIVLTAGTYWIEWQTTVTGGGAHFAPSVTIEGSRGSAAWNSRQLNVAASTWLSNIDGGNPATAPDVPIDLPFDINLVVCGDGYKDNAEACDDGNQVNGDGCDNNCRVTACGNGAISSGEECDDGNQGDGDGCDSNCKLTACGNGIQTGDEQCDDGNTIGGDGCSAMCTREALTGGGVSCQYGHGRTELGVGALWMMLAALGAFCLRRRQRRTA